MTINDLINDLQSTIDFLKKRFSSDTKVRVVSNTYFLGSNHFLATRHGFIDLDNPVGSEEDEDD